MKYFGFFERIKIWVKENNTTIEALLKDATGSKVTKGVYQGWRKRESLPSGEYCYDIAKFMGVSCDWLISGKEFESKEDDGESHRPGLGVRPADAAEYRMSLEKIFENTDSVKANLKQLLDSVLKLDDAGIELIKDEVSLLLRHSNLQARIKSAASEKMDVC